MEHGLIDADALARWLGAETLVVEGAPSSGGWSNETLFVVADGTPLVVRLTPRGRSMFPSYDLSHQLQAMRLATASGLPVPVIVGDESDPAVLGRPFFVMERVPGRVPADDDPPFTKAGFLFDAAPSRQRQFHDEAIDIIARIHHVQPASFVAIGPQPADHMAANTALATWCESTPDVVLAAIGELERSLPTAEPAVCGFLWGDARPANMVVDDDFHIVSLLDWELAATGPGEIDVSWFCEMNRMRSTGMGIAPLPGFPSEDITWQRWQDAIGRQADHVTWYQLYSACRVAVFMQLYLAAMVDQGQLPADHRLLADNPGTRRLHQLLA